MLTPTIFRAPRRWPVFALALAASVMLGTPSGGLAQSLAPTATPVATDTPAPAAPTTVAPAAVPDARSPSISTVDLNLIGPLGGGGGPRNLVKVQNVQANQLRVDGNVQLGRIPGPMAAPANVAEAYSSCLACQTLAVALQVDLITADTQRATPENLAVAVNFNCTQCDTIAIALQYVLTVNDPTQVPPEANQLVAVMRQELKQMNGDPTLTLPEAEARVISVVGQFQDLAASLSQQRDESTAPTTPNASPPTAP